MRLKHSPLVTKVLMSSWRPSTRKQYSVYIKKWKCFCAVRSLDFRKASVEKILEYLAELHNAGLRYSALNTARAALSALLSINMEHKIEQHDLIKRFMKGVFELDPIMPKYNCIWKVSDVTTYLRSLAPATSLTLKELSFKLVMLLALVTGQRIQTLQALDLNNLDRINQQWVFRLSVKLKHTRQRNTQFHVALKPYPVDRRLCVVTYLNEYVHRTHTLRKDDSQLLISFVKPHKKVSRDTIARWLCIVLARAGIDTSKFRAHSTRAASTSQAAVKGVPLDNIMHLAGWSSAGTFQKYYQKPIQQDSFADRILTPT